MRPFLILASWLAFACVSPAFGGGVTLTTVGGKKFAKSNGQPVAEGCLIRVGTFDLPPATREATLRDTADYAKLKSWFRPLGESIQGAGNKQQAASVDAKMRVNHFPTEGEVFGVISDIQTTYLPPGAPLYVWVFDAETAETSEEWGIFTADSWLAPQSLAMRALGTTGEVEPLQGVEQSGQLRLAAPPLTYGNWAMRRFAGDPDQSKAEFNADPDGDGLHNLAEYAWRLDPKVRDQSLANLAPPVASSGAAFSFKVPKGLTDVTVVAESSPDLRVWSAATTEITATDDQFDTHTTTAPAGATSVFWRVRFVSTVSP